MKVRVDFVTNSSSSSFILGEPSGNTVKIKDAKKYMKEMANRLGVTGPAGCEYFIDLRFDKDKEYDTQDINFVVECISWYEWEKKQELVDKGELTEEQAEEPIWIIGEDGEYIEISELTAYQESYTYNEVKAILDYAYETFGEILVGNSEIGFYPSEIYYDGIQHDDSIKYKCNHMG